MKITAEQPDLAHALAATATLARRNWNHGARAIALCAQGGVAISGDDGDTRLTIEIEAEVDDPGTASLPPHVATVIKSCPKGRVTIETDDKVIITSGKMTAEVPLSTDVLAEREATESIGIVDGFVDAFNRVAVAVHDGNRMILTGVNLRTEGGQMTLAATDAYRFATANLTTSADLDSDITVPITTSKHLDGPVEIGIGSRSASFKSNNVTVVTSLIPGDFPTYPNKLVPEATPYRAVFARDALMDVVSRVSAILKSPDVPVLLALEPGICNISATEHDLGETSDVIETNTDADLTIGLNPRYLLDGLKNLRNDEVTIEITDRYKPVAMREDGYLYLVMPVRVS